VTKSSSTAMRRQAVCWRWPQRSRARRAASSALFWPAIAYQKPIGATTIAFDRLSVGYSAVLEGFGPMLGNSFAANGRFADALIQGLGGIGGLLWCQTTAVPEA